MIGPSYFVIFFCWQRTNMMLSGSGWRKTSRMNVLCAPSTLWWVWLLNSPFAFISDGAERRTFTCWSINMPTVLIIFFFLSFPFPAWGYWWGRWPRWRTWWRSPLSHGPPSENKNWWEDGSVILCRSKQILINFLAHVGPLVFSVSVFFYLCRWP